jgi:AcrR family transcriptional regulator
MDAFGIAHLKDRLKREQEDPFNALPTRQTAHERIVAAADHLFSAHGIRAVSIANIAKRAETSKNYVVQCFASIEALAVDYLQRHTRADAALWVGLENKHPGAADEQLRGWLRAMAPDATDRFRPPLFSVEAVELLYAINHPGRAVIREYKAALRQRLAQLCEDAFYRDPEALADKLLMLVEGAFVQRAIFGGETPGQRLIEAAEDLFKRHWANE